MSELLKIIIEIIILLILITGSAFFSSAEMSLFSLSHARIQSFENSASRRERTIFLLMQNYNKTLVTIILSNMFVNSCISMLNDDLIRQTGLNGITSAILSALIAIIVLLLFGEITPMTLAYVYCDPWSKVVAIPVHWLRIILSPITSFVDYCSNKILDLGKRPEPEALTVDEYDAYLSSCAHKGAFTSTETVFLKESLEYSENEVADIMMPRVSMGFLRKNDPPETVEKIIRQSRQFFIPVGTNTPDDADSILLTLHYFLLTPEQRKNWRQENCTRPTVFIPAKASAMLALRKLRTANEPAGLVSDEYGGVAGLISQEGIYLFLTAAPQLVEKNMHIAPRRLTGNKWVLDALTPVKVVSEMTGWIPDSEFEANTLNGTFCERLKTVPVYDDTILDGNAQLRVLAASHIRAEKIEVTIIEKDKGESEC